MTHLHTDTWLAEIIGYPAYKLVVDEELMNHSLEMVWQELAPLKQGKTFAYAKVETNQLIQANFLENLGFRLTDTSTTSEMPHTSSQPLTGNTEIRFARPEDADQVMAVARNNFVYSRFHADPCFENELANTIKAEWAGNYFKGQRGDSMVVAVKNGQVVGFNQLLHKGEVLVIDLIAVDRSARRLKIAEDMSLFADQNCPPHQVIQVTTQVANIPAMRLYEKLGFRLISSQYIFHYHHS